MRGELKDLRLAVLRATDIVDLIGEYVPLTKAGGGYKGLCPFHQERSGSFTVTPSRQTWKCFGVGCGKGGNAIDFLMEREGLEFKEAFARLAERAGISLATVSRGEGGRPGAERGPSARDAREEALAANKVAAEYVRRALVEGGPGSGGARARAYLRERGISDAASARFEIGYAPDRWDGLIHYAGRRGIEAAALERAGLALRRRDGSGFYDRFRDRLIFPIWDETGRVVGFGGRLMPGREEGPENGPKYLNSPESPVFKKGQLLYGLHHAKDAIRKRGEAAVVEGYTAVIAAHEAGFPFVVATLGTAFGGEHARALRRFAPRLVVFYDSDAAGLEANRRSLRAIAETVQSGDVQSFEELRIAVLPDGLDPCDAIVGSGPAAFGEAIERAGTLVDYLIGRATREGDAGAKARALDELLAALAAFGLDTYREMQIVRAAEALRIPEDAIRARAREIREETRKRATARAGTAATRMKSNPESGTGTGTGTGAGTGSGMGTGLAPLERRAIECLLATPALVVEARAVEGILDLVEDPRLREVLGAILESAEAEEAASAAELALFPAGEGARRLASELAASLEPALDYAREWPDVVARLTKRAALKAGTSVGAVGAGAPAGGESDEELRAFHETRARLKAGRR